MRNRFGADERHRHHVATGLLLGLLDGGGHFVGLAIAPTDLAFAVADDDQGGEAESPAAFDDRGAALDLHRLVDVIPARFTITRFVSHNSLRSRLWILKA